MQRNCCLYNHKVNGQNKIKDAEKLEKQVKELELDVATLSKELEVKEKKVQELSDMIVKHNETILDLRTENSNLKSQLSEKHLKLNSEQKEDRFDCEKCEFYSKTQNDLEAHKLSLHEKTEKFICTVCEFSSEKRFDLELHTSTKHPGNLDHRCDFKTEGENQVEN